MSAKLKKKTWKRFIKWGVVLLVIAAVVLYFRNAAKNVTQALYTDDVASIRDIQTYHTFTGTTEPVNSSEIIPAVTGVKVTEIMVEVGDEVKVGDVIMTLDTYSIQSSIDQLSASMDINDATSAISIAQAQKSYDDLKYEIDNGLNSQIQNALSGIDTAFANLVTAQENYNNEVELNNRQLSDKISSAIHNVDTAYATVSSAQTTLSRAQEDLSKAEDNGLSGDSLTSYKRAVEDAQTSVDSAWDSYNYAVSQYEAAKMKEEDSLTSLYDSLITAQINYLNAIDSYNAAVLAVNQELEGYQLTIQSAVAQSNDSVNQLKLADLQKQLSDCTITAPRDGVISALPVEEGSFVASAGSVATVTDYSEMKIAVKIGEYDILGVNEGDSVIVSIDALEATYDGTIKKIAKAATVQGGVSYFEAEVEIEADEVVRSGMSAEVKLIIDDVSQVISVPSAAVQSDSEGNYFVYVKDAQNPKNTTPLQKPVTIGVSDGSYTQIIEGLSEGDAILVPKTDSMALLMEEMSGGRSTSSGEGSANE